MGRPMAERLVECGFPVSVWTRRGSGRRGAPVPKARYAATPADAARDSEVVLTMLRDAGALFQVLRGPDGVLAGLRKRAIVIDMSTIGRAAAREAAKEVEAAGGYFLDVPVSGSVVPASQGKLVGLAGGSPRVLKRAEPVLKALCSRVVYAGAVGQGQALKVILNGVGSHHFVAFASMLALGQRAGLSREVLVDAFTSGAFASPSYVGKRAKVLARDWSPEFTLELTLKDVLLNVELQKELGVSLPVHRAIASQVRDAVASGLGGLDLYAIEEYYAKLLSG